MYIIKELIVHPARNKAQQMVVDAVINLEGKTLQDGEARKEFENFLTDTCHAANAKYPAAKKLEMFRTLNEKTWTFSYSIMPKTALPFTLVTIDLLYIKGDWKGDDVCQ